ncbi:S-layer family protein, partial [Brasilonema sp. CT11]|nr:S-layer family protein [Brasilonema sp. CT11]
PDGKSLLLVGGDIKMDGGGLNAFGGRVELGGLAGAGTVGLNGDGNNLNLSFPNGVERSDVFLSNGAQVNVIAGDGASIAVNARNLEMTGDSQLFAGIDRGLGSNNSQAGDISVNATGAINLNYSGIFNLVLPGANGQVGDVSISASSLRLEGGARIGTTTLGVGKGGSLSVDAQDMQIIGRSADGQFASRLSTSAELNSTGNAGNLTIKTNTLLVRDGAVVNSFTYGAGKGGNLSVDAQDMQIIGKSADGQFPSALSTSAGSNSTGNAGNLTIKTNTLLVRDGAVVSSFTYGAGKGGNLSFDAQDMQIIGKSADGQFPTSLSTSAVRNSTADAGDLTIKTNTLLVQDGAEVNTGTYGAGKGGSLSVYAQDVQLIGTTSPDKPIITGLFASAQRNSTGNAGDTTVKTNTLVVQNGAAVVNNTEGSGKGGSLRIDAQNVQLIGTSANGRVPSALVVSAERNSTGDAGDLTVKANTLLVRDGAQVIASTFGAGKGGSLSVEASDVQLIGGTSADGGYPSGLGATAEGNSTGNAGDITVKTNTLLVQDSAAVTVRSFGTGGAGNMTLNARSIRLNNNAVLTANTRSPKVDPNREQATININSQDLIITGNSNIRTDAIGENVIGGNININASVLAGFQNSDITANSEDFRGGNVRINTKAIFGLQFRDALTPDSDITATGVTRSLSGNVQITTPDIDPTNGLVELPTNLVDVSGQISTACTPGSRQSQSSFVSTGRGGLPMSPTEPLQDTSTLSAWVRLRPKAANSAKTTISPQPTAVSNSTKVAATPIVEATGWIVDRNGNVELVAQAPGVTTHSSWQTPASCPASQ